MPVVVDTTVWIDSFRDAKTPQTETLEMVVRRGEAALGDLILSEILQGVVEDSTNFFREITTWPEVTGEMIVTRGMLVRTGHKGTKAQRKAASTDS